jgi:hypothetical protein
LLRDQLLAVELGQPLELALLEKSRRSRALHRHLGVFHLLRT